MRFATRPKTWASTSDALPIQCILTEHPPARFGVLVLNGCEQHSSPQLFTE
jgi:hypothetical protein